MLKRFHVGTAYLFCFVFLCWGIYFFCSFNEVGYIQCAINRAHVLETIEKDRKRSKKEVIDHRCSSLCLSRCVSGVNDVKVNLFGVEEEEEDEEDDLVVVATKEEWAETEEEREGKEERKDKEETGDKEEKEEHPTTTDTTTVLPTATTTTTTPSKRVRFAMNEKDSTTTTTTRAMFDQIQLATEVLAHAVSEDVTGSSAIAGTGNTFRYLNNTGVNGCRY